MHYQLNGAASQDPIVITTFQQPICTKRILLEICTVTDSVDIMQLQVDLDPTICYVDEAIYVENAGVVMGKAVECALTDYSVC